MTSKEKQSAKPETRLDRLYDLINGEEETRVCRDIPESACKHLPRNYFAYLASNIFSKIGDELSSARLVLPWLFSALGAPASLIGFIVPLREAGVLIPQLAVAAYLRRMPVRKRAWLLGGVVSGLCLLGIGLFSSKFQGAQAGFFALALLTVYSVGRGICSVSAKDVIGKTVSKKRRGTLMGYSSSVSSAALLALGLWLAFLQSSSQGESLSYSLLTYAGFLWLASLLCFSLIKEEPGATDGSGSAWKAAVENMSLLKTDKVFRHYLLTRGLLLSVALAPPYYALLSQQRGENASALGLLIVAGGLAGTVSGPIWGKLADRSSRLTMVFGALGAGALGIGIYAADLGIGPSWASQSWVQASLFFGVNVCYGGVRLGRKAYLVDMVSGDKSGYVAVGNTLTGAALLLLGSIGALADAIGASGAIAMLALLAFAGAASAFRLKEVSG
ncbi:MFS transporter [Pelagicoccus sp. SDUM812003]|uniref:MFS transporter n=1 Tax=Pelagicoccus sp. SDUM812003 TaxID=3041267 RepID=UPI0028105BC1|nr:MFS transporter [Pelagicoccus sp. SDUM812003]MDQ8204054.1 MFS transporter [Pelagicoccus sp. SDUM812003]